MTSCQTDFIVFFILSLVSPSFMRDCLFSPYSKRKRGFAWGVQRWDEGGSSSFSFSPTQRQWRRPRFPDGPNIVQAQSVQTAWQSQ